MFFQLKAAFNRQWLFRQTFPAGTLPNEQWMKKVPFHLFHLSSVVKRELSASYNKTNDALYLSLLFQSNVNLNEIQKGVSILAFTSGQQKP